MDRRTFVAAATGMLAATLESLAAPERKGRINQSICQWCFSSSSEKWTLDKTCQVAKDLGCVSVELLGSESFATLKKNGLVCAITSNGMPGGFQRGFNNLRHREELITKTKSAIDATAEAGFKTVIGFVGMQWIDPTDPKSGSIPKDEAFKNCVEGLKQIAGYAESKKIQICVEHLNSRDGTHPMKGHPGYQGDDLDFVVEILRKVGSSHIKLLFDIYHVQVMHGDLIRRIEQCKEWIGHVHTAGNPGRCELGASQEINYPAVMKKLVEIGYQGYVGHEFIPTVPPIDGLKEAVSLCDV
jgi:hydroxypyruvate isomerase